MSDDASGPTEPTLKRREVLAATTTSALAGVAGCGGVDPDSCDLNTGWDEDNDTTLGDSDDDDDWQVVAESSSPAPTPRPASIWGGIAIVAPFDDSRWIDNTVAGTQTGSGPVTYGYCFCLPEGVVDPELVLQVQAAKEIVDVRLNGASLPFTSSTGPMGNATMEEETYDDPGRFEEGDNCLHVVVDHQDATPTLNVAGTLEHRTADCDCECDCPPSGGECSPTVSKAAEGAFHYGQQATYTHQICNEGDGDCPDEFIIGDHLPDGVTFVSAAGDWSGTVSSGVATVTNDSQETLAPGECITVELTVDVDPLSAFPGDPPHEVENCSFLFQGGGESIDEDCISHDITPPGECELTLSKELAGEFVYGDAGTYVVEVCNEGGTTCRGPLEVEDDLPTGLSFDGVSGSDWTASVSGGTVTATNDNDGGLGPGECTSFELNVDIVPPGEAPDEIENCATLVHDGDVVAEACVDHPLSYEACDLSVEKSVDGEFHFGEENTYVFEICNERDEPCAGPLTIEDDLPDGISFVSIGGFWNASVSGGVVEATLDTSPLDPDECITAEMIVDVDPVAEFDDDSVENCVELFHDGDTEAEDCIEHPVVADPCALSLEKSTTGEFHYGEQFQAGYVFEVCNDGDEECTRDIELTDPLPDGVSGPVNPGSGLIGGVTGGIFEGTILNTGLAPGECLTRELYVTVEDAEAFSGDPPHGVENCAELLQDETSIAEDCVRHQIAGGEETACEYTFEKDTDSRFTYGQQATYSFEICSDPDLNDGECTGPLTIEDDLPDGISFVSVGGDWTATVSGGVVEATNDSYGGLDPGECLTMELTVGIADEDEFPGDPPHEIQNCAVLQHDDDTVSEDCVTHEIQ